MPCDLRTNLCVAERRSDGLSDSTTICEFIMFAVVARRISEPSGGRTRALDGRPTYEENMLQTAALHASAGATRPLLPTLAAFARRRLQTCQSVTACIRKLSDGARSRCYGVVSAPGRIALPQSE